MWILRLKGLTAERTIDKMQGGKMTCLNFKSVSEFLRCDHLSGPSLKCTP